MSNFSQSWIPRGRGGPPSNSAAVASTSVLPRNNPRITPLMVKMLLELVNPNLREKALREISQNREVLQDLAPLLWCSFGAVVALLQEVMAVYPFLLPPKLNDQQSDRVCNAIVLLKCVAGHPDTKELFVDACLYLYIFPLLKTTSKVRAFENMRVTCLCLVGELVKVDDRRIIFILLGGEVFPLCLLSMQHGDILSKSVAAFVIEKILLNDEGLDYACYTQQRFVALSGALTTTLYMLALQPQAGILKRIVSCYLRLSDNSNACIALRSCLPISLQNVTFSCCYREDPDIYNMLQELLQKVHGSITLGQGGL